MPPAPVSAAGASFRPTTLLCPVWAGVRTSFSWPSACFSPSTSPSLTCLCTSHENGLALAGTLPPLVCPFRDAMRFLTVPTSQGNGLGTILSSPSDLGARLHRSHLPRRLFPDIRIHHLPDSGANHARCGPDDHRRIHLYRSRFPPDLRRCSPCRSEGMTSTREHITYTR